MRIRNVKNSEEIIENSKYIISNPEEYKGKFKKEFNNENPIHIEIGMGKGNFIIGMAKTYPNINFIGIEKYDSIVAKALLKLNEEDLPNLRIIKTDALNLPNIFDKEISEIYLNFSDPWPKARHAKRRLTSPIFLNIYDKIFKGDSIITQKTDNTLLFESSIINYSNYGYIINDISLDLANTEIPNVETEYEKKFKSQGIKINYIKVEKKHK